MKPLSEREKRLITEAYDAVLKDTELTRDVALRFTLRVLDYDRRQMATWGAKHIASIMSMIIHSKRDIGRAFHPDAMIAVLLCASLMLPKLSGYARDKAAKFMDIAGPPYEVSPSRTTFEEKYGFNDDVYVKFMEMLGASDDVKKVMNDFVNSATEKERVEAMAESAGFQRIDTENLPEEVLAALKKMGLDINHMHVINIDTDDDGPLKH